MKQSRRNWRHFLILVLIAAAALFVYLGIR